MQDEVNPLTPVERELEAALHTLTPADHHIDRDTLMFRLGRDSMTRSRGRWQMAAAAMLLVAVASWSWPALAPPQVRPAMPGLPEMIADSQEASPLPAPRQRGMDIVLIALAPAGSILDLRNQVLIRGDDALPGHRADSNGDCSQSELEPLIQWPYGQPPPSMWLRNQYLIHSGDNS